MRGRPEERNPPLTRARQSVPDRDIACRPIGAGPGRAATLASLNARANRHMKLLFDFFPVLLFFVAFKLHDDPQQGFLTATVVIIIATMVQMTVWWFLHKRVEKLHIITLVLLVTFGGITLALQDEIYLKWKPTAVNWLFGLAFLGSEYIGKKSLLKRLMEANIKLPEPVWTRLNFGWVGFFLFAGALNLYVVYNYDTDTWVDFKLFGLMGLTLVFVVAQGFYLVRHIEEDKPETTD